MNRTIALGVTILLFFFLLAGVARRTQAQQAFTIFYSNDVHGEIEPCG